MCTLILYYKLLENYPIVVAANRDEQYSRKALAPHVICQHPRIYAGTDEQAGGTWLGVNEFGLLVGIVNRHSPQPQDPARRSRGILCRDLLCQKDANAAREAMIAEGRARPYNSFYFMWADAEHAYVAANEGDITIRELDLGAVSTDQLEPDRSVAAHAGRYRVTSCRTRLHDRWTPCSRRFRRCAKAIRRSNESLMLRMSTAAIVRSVCTPRSSMGPCLPVCWRLVASGPRAAISMPRGRRASRHIVIFRHCSPADMFRHHRLEIGFFTISVVQQLSTILSSFETE